MSSELLPIVADTAQPITKALGGTLSDVWQGIIGDRVAGWRIANAVKIDAKLKAKLDEAGVVLLQDSLPEGVAFKWFEEATQADEPEIQELFAQLLANAATGNVDALRKRNIELISSLSPEDARFLSFYADQYTIFLKESRANYTEFSLSFDTLFYREYKEAGFETSLPIDSLLSLGILRLDREFGINKKRMGQFVRSGGFETPQHALATPESLMAVMESLTLTSVGKSLIQAILPGKSYYDGQ